MVVGGGTQRNPSRPENCSSVIVSLVELVLGVPQRENLNPIPIFWATMVPVTSQFTVSDALEGEKLNARSVFPETEQSMFSRIFPSMYARRNFRNGAGLCTFHTYFSLNKHCLTS